MFQVLENGELCDHEHFPEVDLSWDNAEFSTFDEAKRYAVNWFWPYLGYKDIDTFLEINKPYNYSGYGDMAEIREVPS